MTAHTAAEPLFDSAVTAVALSRGTNALTRFVLADAPIHRHVAPSYLEASAKHEMPPNVVTAVLADFRGYDTLGETTVIFTGGVGVMLLLRGRRKRLKSGKEGKEGRA